jgi:hypothetical protein
MISSCTTEGKSFCACAALADCKITEAIASKVRMGDLQ